ncbi:MAG: tRNA 2-selenouridine(34) synthase MnmH [Sediminibacterium sp.]|jgi:tRNA 2-selenouridine synthase|nr:tRNA 2-selenouridine(34) synthase MnmH [Sediminibacterium sp.]
MAVQKIDIDDFIIQAPHSLIIDVRSPGEFDHAHIVSALNLSLFTNEERAIVGTTYKKQSREAAIKVGLPLFGTKLLPMIETVEKWVSEKQEVAHTTKPNILVHCWRGGMRSAAVAWLLDLYGYKVYQLTGGYKAYRNWVLNQFIKEYSIKVLGGFTGSGKTEILHALQQRNNTVIDLEGLANHKGSAFGAIGQAVQPSQEMFENKLATALFTNKTDLPFWVEDESQRIGLVMIPNSFFIQMRNSVCHFIIIPFEERLNFILQGYGSYDVQLLIDATVRIQKRLGGLETKNAVQFFNDNNIIAAFAILLKYYDRWYEKNTLSASPPKLLVQQFYAEKVDPMNNAILVEKR